MNGKKVVTNCSNTIRQAKNAAEKQRRDKLNNSINDLANTVPFTPYPNKRLDKISILRLSAAYLRLHKKYSFLRARPELERKELIMMDKLVETLNGFMLLLNNDRKIILTSQNCFDHLGHQNIDMIGNNLDTFIHPFENAMIQEELDQLKIDLNSTENYKSRSIALRCRMKTRIHPKTEFPNYQFVQISGHMINIENGLSSNRLFNRHFGLIRTKSHPYMRSTNFNLKNSTSYQSLNNSSSNTSINSTNLNQSFNCQYSDQNSKYLFIGFVETIQRDPFENLTLFEALQDEYNTLFTLDCKLLAIDHRISNILGFLPKELINSYAHTHIHENDQHISKIAHQMMLDSADGISKVVHRLKTKNGNFVYIASIGKLNFDESRTPQNFVCFNRLLSNADGEKERAKLVQKISLQSMNTHQTNEKIPFEYTISKCTNLNANKSNHQNELNLEDVKNNSKPEPNEMIKMNSALKINNSLNNQQNYCNYLINPTNQLNPLDTYLKLDTNLVQNSSLSFLIVNQLDVNKLSVQQISENSSSDSSINYPNNSINQFSTNQFNHIDNKNFSRSINTITNSNQIVEQTINRINENSDLQCNNTENSNQESLNFLEQCPNNGSNPGSFSNHPVKCY